MINILTSLAMVMCLAISVQLPASTSALFSDSFSDQLVATPTYSPTGAQWVVGTGLVSAGSDEPSGFSYYLGQSGTLMFTKDANTKVSIDFGATTANTPVEARFKLAQSEGSHGSYLFNFGFKNTALNKSLYQNASPNVGYFGPLGAGSGFDPGGIMGMGYHLSWGGWDYMKMFFYPATHVVEIWQSTDGGVNYTKVATWTDTQNLTSVNQFFFDCQPGSTGTSWRADDVEIYSDPLVDEIVFSPDAGWYTAIQNVAISCPTPGATIRYTTDGSDPTETTGTVIASGASIVVDRVMTLKARAWAPGYSPRSDAKSSDYKIYTQPWVPKPNAVQTIYQSGVPHTDKSGNFRLTYDPALSFFPIGHYAAWVGTQYGQTWSYTTFANAGFNCCMPWSNSADDVASSDAAQSAGIQLIHSDPTDTIVNALKNHPATLAWRVYEEPTAAYWGQDMQGYYDAFLTRKAQIKAMGSNQPVYTLDCAWINEPATSWWSLWNSAGDVSCHDNYPIYGGTNTISFPNGVPETISLAVSVNNGNKPVWLVAQSFGVASAFDPNSWKLPTPAQERCMIYTSIIHGATGLIYFMLDTWISRDSGIIGIAPRPLENYGHYPGVSANSAERAAIRELFYAVVDINSQITGLKPVIFSPTSTVPYEVSLSNTLPYVTETPIRTMLKIHPAGGMVLLLANVDGVPQISRIRFPGRQFVVSELYGTLGFTKGADYIEMNNPAWDARVFRIFDLQTIGDAKNQATGTLACSGVVSAVFTDYLYIETADRTYGIRVNKTAHGRTVGQVVNVTGTPQTLDSGERCIVADDVTATGATGDVQPMVLNNRSLGGGALGLQEGIAGGVGLNNIGLLVRMTGKVKTTGTGWFMIDDGSGVSVKIVGTAPSGNPYVSVTGASSCEKVSSLIQRVIVATNVQTL